MCTFYLKISLPLAVNLPSADTLLVWMEHNYRDITIVPQSIVFYHQVLFTICIPYLRKYKTHLFKDPLRSLV